MFIYNLGWLIATILASYIQSDASRPSSKNDKRKILNNIYMKIIYFLDLYACLLSLKNVRHVAVLVAENGIGVSGSNPSRGRFVPLYTNTIGKV